MTNAVPRLVLPTWQQLAWWDTSHLAPAPFRHASAYHAHLGWEGSRNWVGYNLENTLLWILSWLCSSPCSSQKHGRRQYLDWVLPCNIWLWTRHAIHKPYMIKNSNPPEGDWFNCKCTSLELLFSYVKNMSAKVLFYILYILISYVNTNNKTWNCLNNISLKTLKDWLPPSWHFLILYSLPW